jgi:hypothetical protein
MGWFTDLLKEYPALEVARERIALAEAKFANLETENVRLQEEVAGLRRENESLKSRMPVEGFIEARGALFKRRVDGSFEPDAYCPACKSALAPFPIPGAFGPSCSRCRYRAPFKSSEIPQIIKELQSSYSQ